MQNTKQSMTNSRSTLISLNRLIKTLTRNLSLLKFLKTTLMKMKILSRCNLLIEKQNKLFKKQNTKLIRSTKGKKLSTQLKS